MIVCLFDIDGTLLSSGGAGKAALETALTEDFTTTLRAQVPYAGRTDRAIVRDLLQVHDIADTPANIERSLPDISPAAGVPAGVSWPGAAGN